MRFCFHLRKRYSIVSMIAYLAFMSVQQNLKAQQKPPRPVTVYVNPAQGLSFGAFYQGVAGGTVIISHSGSRSVTGGVVAFNQGSFSPAIFQLEALPGTMIHILNGPDITLTGSNGGTMTMKVGPASVANTFITNMTTTFIRIGGTLTVGASLANPPGAYSGSFSVTFIQE